MTRSFNNQSIPTLIMPRVSIVSFVLCWIGLFIFMVRADLKKQTNPPQLLADGAANSAASFQKHVRCECEFFVQSWKTSHMIRLPMGIKPVLGDSSTNNDLCVTLCQNQLPPLPEDEKDLSWARIFKGACRTLLVNDYSARHGTPNARTIGRLRSGDNTDNVRGCLQAYARSVDTHVWVPMGLQYRKLLSCSHPRSRR